MLLGLEPETAVDICTVLPNTIQRLCLHWDFSGVSGDNMWGKELYLFDCVRQLLPNQQSRLPRLKQIVIRIWDTMRQHYDHYFKQRAEIQQACAAMGIEFHFVSDQLSLGLWT